MASGNSISGLPQVKVESGDGSSAGWVHCWLATGTRSAVVDMSCLTWPGLDLRVSAMLALQCLLHAQLQQPDDPLGLLNAHLIVALIFSRH